MQALLPAPLEQQPMMLEFNAMSYRGLSALLVLCSPAATA